jgi:hypothetical protein
LVFDKTARAKHVAMMSKHPLSAPSVSGLYRATGAILAGLLILRVLVLLLDPNSLYADETQYWLWSREVDWGYFSKPPMIAWIIAATTAVFGDADWAVRLAAPFLHTDHRRDAGSDRRAPV